MGKITDQTDGGAGLGTDEFVINRAGVDYKLTLTNVVKSVQDALTTEISDRQSADTTLTNTKLNRDGDTLTDYLTLHADPTSALHAATRQYVLTQTTGKLSTTGGTMTGGLVLAGDPTAALEPVTKQYLEGANGIGGTWRNTSDVDCSASPNYSASSAGDTYRVSVAGKIGGGSGPDVQVDDIIYCHTASAAGDQATVGANFSIIQTNVVAATETQAGYVQFADSTEMSGSPALLNKAISPLQSEIRLSRVVPGYNKVITAATTVNIPSTTYSAVYICTGTASASTAVNLPEISTLPLAAITLTIKDGGFNAAANYITVTPGGSDLIDGIAAFIMTTNKEVITLVNDGATNWYVV